MTRLNKEITKKAKCNVLDHTLKTVESHKKDLTSRLAKQEKNLKKTIQKGWSGQRIIEKSIEDIKTTLAILDTYTV